MARLSKILKPCDCRKDYWAFVRVTESVPPDGSPDTPNPLVQSLLPTCALEDVDIGDHRKLFGLTAASVPIRVERYGYAESPTILVVTEPAEFVVPAFCVTSPTTLK